MLFEDYKKHDEFCQKKKAFYKKSRIRETSNLSTDVDCRTDTILISSVKAILKAMTDTFLLVPSLGGGQNFLFTVGGFFNEREYCGAD